LRAYSSYSLGPRVDAWDAIPLGPG
jgi:hypothetical protein